MFLLLEGAVYAAGIVRNYCSNSVNVRRLVHLGAVETAVTGMRVTAVRTMAKRVDNFTDNSENEAGIECMFVEQTQHEWCLGICEPIYRQYSNQVLFQPQLLSS